MLQENLWQAGENSRFEKEFPSDSIWQTIRTSHYRMNDAIIWCVSRSVSGHIQRAFVPNSDHSYRRIWLEKAISYIAFVSPECEHVKSLSRVRLCDSVDCHLPGSPGDSPWSFSGKSTGVGCHFLLQGIFTWIARSFSMFFGSTCYIVGMTMSHLVGTSFSWTDAIWKALW